MMRLDKLSPKNVLPFVIMAFSRVVGLMREFIIASLMGISRSTDQFYLVLQLIQIPYSYFFGAAHVAQVPILKRRKDNLIPFGLFLGELKFLLIYVLISIGFLAYIDPLALSISALIMVLSVLVFPILASIYSYYISRKSLSTSALILVLPNLIFVAFLFLMQLIGIDIRNGIFLASGCSFIITGIIFFVLNMKIIKPAVVERYDRKNSLLENLGFNLNTFANTSMIHFIGEGFLSIYTFSMRLASVPLLIVTNTLASKFASVAQGKDFANDIRKLAKYVFMNILTFAFMLILMNYIAFFVYGNASISKEELGRIIEYSRILTVAALAVSISQFLSRIMFLYNDGERYAYTMNIGYVTSFLMKLLLILFGYLNIKNLILCIAFGDFLSMLLNINYARKRYVESINAK